MQAQPHTLNQVFWASLDRIFTVLSTEACKPRARGAMLVLLEVAIALPSSNSLSCRRYRIWVFVPTVEQGQSTRSQILRFHLWLLLLLVVVVVVVVAAAAVVVGE